MKIVLRAFQNKLSGLIEVPEETGPRFKLVLEQPIQYKKRWSYEDTPLMEGPIQALCEFEFTGGIFSQKGHPWDGAREYQLVSIEKIN